MAKAQRKQQVEAAIKKINGFYALGRKIPPKLRHRDVYGRRVIEARAESLGRSPELVRQARQFVETYSEDELDELCRKIMENQIDAEPGTPNFGKTQVILLMTVTPKRQRAALQRKAIEQCWSASRLKSEIARRFGTRRQGGRRRRVPPDLPGMLTQLEVMCENWRRWQAEVSRPADEVRGRHPVFGDLPRSLRVLVNETGKVLGRLHEAVLEELESRQPGWERRAALREEEGRRSSTQEQGRRNRARG